MYPPDAWVAEFSPSQGAYHVECLRDAITTTTVLLLHGALDAHVDGRPDYFIIGVFATTAEASAYCRSFRMMFAEHHA